MGSTGSTQIEEQTLKSHLVTLTGLSNVDESVVLQSRGNRCFQLSIHRHEGVFLA